MTRLFWHRLFKLPQTQLLITGTLLGYLCLLAILRPRPLPIFGGGLVALGTLSLWVVEIKKELSWMQDDLLERELFQLRLRTVEQKIGDISNSLWQQVKTWILEIQELASRIRERQPDLTPELLETLYTTLVLAEQLADKLLATHQVRTETYREMAQQQLQAHCDRLQATHDQLQQLHDQMILLASDTHSISQRTEIPAQLRLVIEANRITLETPTNQP